MLMNQKRKLPLSLVLLVCGAALIGGLYADSALKSSATRQHTHNDLSALDTYFGATASVDSNAGLDTNLAPLQLVWRVLRTIKDNYVDSVDPFDNTKMAHNAVRYMVGSLGDSGSRFLDKDQVSRLKDMAFGKFHGIGAVLKIRELKNPDWTDMRITVVSAIPGSPADKAGLLPGDVITEVDNKWVMSHDPFSEAYKVSKDYTKTLTARRKAYKDAEALREKAIGLEEAFDKLTSPGKSDITLKIRRGNVDRMCKITPDDLEAAPVTGRMVADGIGYVRIGLLTPGAVSDFRQTLKGFEERGAKALVLDLRNSPGGAIVSAQAVAGTLMPGKKLSQVMHSRGRRTIIYANPPTASSVGYTNLVTLVNEGTEGASEVLAGGLRDSAKAKLIGQNTWGNAFENTAFRLEDGSGYTLTTGKYLTPGGINFNKNGLKPDAIVPMSPSKIGTTEDTQLERAITVAKRPAA